jgi:acetyl-CoA C-acetyltransferase/acetyl-CoA acyltransferase
MAVDLWKQLTGKAGDYQVRLDPKRRYGLLINMGGNDKTVVSAVFRAAA